MKIIISHSGKQHSYHVAKAMKDLGVLHAFYTSSYIKRKKVQEFLLKNKNQYWIRRFKPGLYGKNIKTRWDFEMKEILYRKLFGKTDLTQNAVYTRDVKFDHHVASKLKKQQYDLFWGFQGSCHESLKMANQLHKISVCELATAHVVAAKKILGEEAKLHPEWADSIDNLEFEVRYETRLQEEPHLANCTVAASRFTRQTLLDDGIPNEKIILLPLGFEMEHIPFELETLPRKNRPLRLLYSGTVTQRKGIKYLLEAIKGFNKTEIELHIIGGIQGKGEALSQYKDYFFYHPPVSQYEMFKKYREFDALILPTIFEGFGLVIIEAMAAGLPVITTDHSIGPDLINDRKNGMIVPIRNSKAIEQAIQFLANQSDKELREMRKKARQAAMNYSWNNYNHNLKKVLHQKFNPLIP